MFSFILFIATWTFLGMGTFFHPLWVSLAVVFWFFTTKVLKRESRKALYDEEYWRQEGDYHTTLAAYCIAGTITSFFFLFSSMNFVMLASTVFFVVKSIWHGLKAMYYAAKVLAEE